MLVYFGVQLVGMSLYGVEAWTRRGDAFGVWFGLLALLAPVGRRADGRLVLRPPAVAATRLAAVTGTTALLLVAIGSTGFDGAKEGPAVQRHRRPTSRTPSRASARRRASGSSSPSSSGC